MAKTDILSLSGYMGRTNTVLLSHRVGAKENVVYFPGDTQEMKEVMTQQYSETAQWSEWCFENMITLLQIKFPASNIWIVKPSKMPRNIYSCYHNFLECSNTVGAPEYTDHYGAIPHLRQLLLSAAKIAAVEVSSLPVVLVGFSKGCVVLNQIVHELDHTLHHQLPSDPIETFDDQAFVKLFKAIYWLDSGHNGESGAWMTKEKDIKALSSLGAELYVHVTPSQVCDVHRGWIGEEHSQFMLHLKKLGVKVHDKFHYKDEPCCLENHFRLLNEF